MCIEEPSTDIQVDGFSYASQEGHDTSFQTITPLWLLYDVLEESLEVVEWELVHGVDQGEICHDEVQDAPS